MPRVKKADREFIAEAVEFLAERESDETDNRDNHLADLRFAFVPGAQWDETAKTRRKGRPCYSYNRTVGAINSVIGDQRIASPHGKVRAMNSQGIKTADLMAGMIRDIESSSSAEDIYDEAFKYGVAGGWGGWRVVPEFADGETFDQVLRIRRVPNPLTMFFDGFADPYGRGSHRVLVADRMPRAMYNAQYGERLAGNLPVSRDSKGWVDDKTIRVGEFYKKDYNEKRIALLDDGRIIPADKVRETVAELEGAGLKVPKVVRERTVKQWYVCWMKTDGVNVLEGPIEYPYVHIPAVRMPGRHVNIEGKQYFQSLILHSKDAQRTYNYDRSSMVETVALTPRAPWIVTSKMIQGHEDMWKKANVSNSPYLVADVDPDDPRRVPTRNPGPEVPQAYMALAAHDAEDIRQTTGYINPALDQQTASGDAESGKALRTRLTTSNAGTYEFLDNYGKAIRFTHDILLDCIPVTYDTARMVRVLDLAGRESFKEFEPKALKDARHDVTVTLGPAYATGRMEALDTLLEASAVLPEIVEEASDVIVRNLDVVGGSEIEQRLRARKIREGKIQPTEADLQSMPPAPPEDPTQKALARSLDAKSEKDEASAEQTRVETQQSLAEALAATRREQLELRTMFDESKKVQAETALILKELRAPREKKGATPA